MQIDFADKVRFNGFRRIEQFPLLKRLEAIYRGRRRVDNIYWNEIADATGFYLHPSYDRVGERIFATGRVFKATAGKIMICFPAFEGGKYYGDHLEGPMETYASDDALPVHSHAIVSRLITIHESRRSFAA